MLVRSHGQLLARVWALLALWAAGTGCQTTRPVRPVIAQTTAAAPAASAAPRFSFFRRSKPSLDALVAATDGKPGVIASSWEPSEPVPSTPVITVGYPASGPAGAPAPLVVESADSPWRPVAVAQSGPAVGVTEAPPAAAVEPAPTPRLVPQPVAAVHPLPAKHHHHAAAGSLPLPVPAAPREFEKQALPPYRVEPPDILLIQASQAITLPTQPLQGQHLVRPDGTINLGIYGSVYVNDLTLDEIRDVVANQLKARKLRGKKEDGKPGEELTLEEIKLELQVDVLAYNSKVYYIITDGGGYGEQVYRIPSTGNETVLDALSQINGLPAVASKKKIWIARATPDHTPQAILPVDWCGIVQRGQAATNYQVFPGDRVYVNSDHWIQTDSWLGKRLAPVERMLGITLLGSSTVNSIRNGGNGSNNTSGR